MTDAPPWQLIYGAIVFAGMGYFLFRRRPLDVWTIAFCSAVIYFYPGWLGETSIGGGDHLAIDAAVYQIWSVVLGGFWSCGVWSDFNRRKGNSSVGVARPEFSPSDVARDRLQGNLLVAVCAFAAAAALWTGGFSSFFALDRAQVIQESTRWNIITKVSALLGVPVAWSTRRPGLAVLPLLILGIDFLAGTRAYFTLAILACGLCLALERPKPQRLARRVLLGAPLLLAFLALMLSSKVLTSSFRQGDLARGKQIVTTAEYWTDRIELTEPVTQQHILNVTVRTGFQLPASHYLDCVRSAAQRFVSEEGGAADFGAKFTAQFFPEISFGLASNPWAEAWAVQGWGGLLLMGGVLCLLLSLMWRRALRCGGVERGVLALALMFLSFFFHRLDFYRLLSLFGKQILPIVLLLQLPAAFGRSATRRSRSAARA